MRELVKRIERWLMTPSTTGSWIFLLSLLFLTYLIVTGGHLVTIKIDG